MIDSKEFIKKYFKERVVAFPEFYSRRPLLPIEQKIVEMVPPDSHVLDLCCGGGEISLAIAKTGKGAVVVGVDNVPEMVDLCKVLFTEEGQFGHFYVADATKLSFADSQFSCVVCTGNSLNSMSNEDARKTILEASRVTKSDGTLYFTVLNPMGLRNILAILKGIAQRAPAWGFYYRNSYGLRANTKDVPRGMSFLISPLKLRKYLRDADLRYTVSHWNVGFIASHLLLTCRKFERET